jgi:flagellar biosynthesis protein FlhA
MLMQRVKRSQFDVGLAMDPELTQGIIREIEPKISEMVNEGLTPLLVTSSELRLALRRFMEPSFPQLVILAFQEIPTETMIEPYAAISLTEHSIPDEITNAFSSQQSQDGVSLPDKVEMPV